jgi:hypothetical protein
VRKKIYRCCVSHVIQSRHKKRKTKGKNMGRPKGSKNQEQPESVQPEPSEGYTLYLVNYWVPFPSSEYGGMQAVVAKDDEECYKLIAEADTWEIGCHKNAEELIRARVKKAARFQLVGDHLEEVVRSFTT